MDDNVMGKYATLSSQAKHYVQYDQGRIKNIYIYIFFFCIIQREPKLSYMK